MRTRLFCTICIIVLALFGVGCGARPNDDSSEPASTEKTTEIIITEVNSEAETSSADATEGDSWPTEMSGSEIPSESSEESSSVESITGAEASSSIEESQNQEPSENASVEESSSENYDFNGRTELEDDGRF